MSDFLGSLIDRGTSGTSTLRPRLASRFEPLPIAPVMAGAGYDLNDSPTEDVDRSSDLHPEPRNPTINVPSSRDHRVESLISENRPDPVVRSIDPVDGRQWNPRTDGDILPFDTNSSEGHASPVVGQETFVPHTDRRISDRLNDLAVQLNQLRSAPRDNRNSSPAPIIVSSDTNQSKDRKKNESLEQASSSRSRFEQQNPIEPDQAFERLTPRVPVNVASDAMLAPRKPFEPREERHSPLAVSQLHPVPKIVPENLPTSSNQSSTAQPTINVTIGRVEVKATRDNPPARQSKPKSNSSVMSLQDYLQRRAAGGSS